MRLFSLFGVLGACLPALAADSTIPDTPDLILKKLQPAGGLKVRMIAQEPQLKNPVAFSIDEQGRIYVVETYRLHHGVSDIRGHMDWLIDDLACKTIEGEAAMYRKHLSTDEVASWSKQSDVIRLLEDTNHDGVIDSSKVFATGFEGLVSGIAAGVLATGGNVWFTDIPSFWRLQDTNGDGVADKREALSTGYGVHLSFLGHDLHGVILGPDGRLYFSVGDRGMNVQTTNSKLYCPDTGAVMRCEPDGSHLEIFATGLRNPQDLTFDDEGNLWTGDNNCDSGDLARLVNVVEGGDSGWRIGYQSLSDRGPWNNEKLWHLGDNAASQVPPIGHVGHGPSGIVFNPGTGLPPQYDRHFLMCDFPGGVLSFAVNPKGSSFEVADVQHFLWEMYATDVDYSPSGGVYVLDWVFGWDQPEKGRIFEVTDPKTMADPIIAETKTLIEQDLSKLPLDDLTKLEETRHLLNHRDRRVRQKMQLALASHGTSAMSFLKERVRQSTEMFEQLHIVWAIGQIARSGSKAANAVLPLLDSRHPQVRGQAAETAGEFHLSWGENTLATRLLADPDARVRFHVAMALGKLRQKDAIVPLLDALRKARNNDAYLRHAVVMSLARLAGSAELAEIGKDQSPAVRLGAVLALRRLENGAIANFVLDPDALVRLEAARAINDVPIDAGTALLAAQIKAPTTDEPFMLRAVHAAFRMGDASHADALARYAGRAEAPESARLLAIKLLSAWGGPTFRDAVTGAYRPMPARDPVPARDALRQAFTLIMRGSEAIQLETMRAIASLQATALAPRLVESIRRHALSPDVRAEALGTLATLQDAQLSSTVLAALNDSDQPVVRQAISLLAESKIPDSLNRLDHVIFSDAPTPTRQAAIAALSRIHSAQGDSIILKCLDGLLSGKLSPALQLDVMECAGGCGAEAIKQKLSAYKGAREKADLPDRRSELMEGGDATAGKAAFEKPEAMCVKCHAIGGKGGQVGPELGGIGAIRTRRQLLESLLLPNKEIAPEYRCVIVATDQDTYVGRVIKENDQQLILLDAQGLQIRVKKPDIQSRQQGLSAMPENVTEALNPRQIRDLVAYLASLKSPTTHPN